MSIIFFSSFLCYILILPSITELKAQASDSLANVQPDYDPFGPENSPDHNGHGSGGVLTPSPYEDVMQTYYTRIGADYSGIQNMLDCPLQLSTGLCWTGGEQGIYGILFKMRTTGFKNTKYDPVLEHDVATYHLPSEVSFDYSLNDNDFKAFKIRLHYETRPKSLGMAGIGVLISDWNLMVARDNKMNRKTDIELTWIQVAGGYVMPLSPKVGGLNIAVCGALDLIGAKYQDYFSDSRKFYGAKIGSIGWLIGIGWNALKFMNLSVYVGGEWSFSTGGVELSSDNILRADISRNTLYFGLQIIGTYFNLTGGVNKEQERLSYPNTEKSENAVRYYFGINYYFRR